MALHEALLNAIQHGNLEVSSELRQSDAERTFVELTEARRQQAPYRDRHVGVQVRLTPRQAVYVVTDEGGGFNPGSLPDPSDPANLERIGGRGLTLIRTFMDEVRHNEQGNQITMTKALSAVHVLIAHSPRHLVAPRIAAGYAQGCGQAQFSHAGGRMRCLPFMTIAGSAGATSCVSVRWASAACRCRSCSPARRNHPVSVQTGPSSSSSCTAGRARSRRSTRR